MHLPAVLALWSTTLLNLGSASGSTGREGATEPQRDAVATNQRAMVSIAAAYRVMNTNPVEALEQARQAVLQADLLNEAAVEHKALVCLARIEEQMGFFPSSMKSTLTALQVAQDLGDPMMIAMDLRELSRAYRLNGMPVKAVEEARNSLAMLLSIRNETEIAAGQLVLIQAMIDAGQLDQAYAQASTGMAKAKQQGDTVQQAQLNKAIGAVYVCQRNYPDAVVHLTQAERILANRDMAAEQLGVYEALTMAFIGLGRTEEALNSLGRASGVLRKVDTWGNRQRVAELRYRLAVAEQDWHKAIALVEGIRNAADSLSHARMDMQLASMQLNRELVKKEKANSQLRTENAQRAKYIAEVLSQNRVLIASLAVASILAVALLLSGRHGRRMARRLKLKNAVIKRQNDEIHMKNLELQRQNMRLAEALLNDEEKEMMIKEIHHRVKNNLQVVDSLLHIQGIELADPAMDRVLRETQGRIRSMALVHDQIYQTSGAGQGDLRVHLEKLARNILVAYGMHDRISVRIETDLPLFPMDTLLPFTLVVNELLTNALKYAFKEQVTGRITLSVGSTAEGYELYCHDDGSGLTQGESPAHSFGLELVRMLAQQLNGTLRIDSDLGTTVRMTFIPEITSMRLAS